jgi:hypothetical protein
LRASVRTVLLHTFSCAFRAGKCTDGCSAGRRPSRADAARMPMPPKLASDDLAVAVLRMGLEAGWFASKDLASHRTLACTMALVSRRLKDSARNAGAFRRPVLRRLRGAHKQPRYCGRTPCTPMAVETPEGGVEVVLWNGVHRLEHVRREGRSATYMFDGEVPTAATMMDACKEPAHRRKTKLTLDPSVSWYMHYVIHTATPRRLGVTEAHIRGGRAAGAMALQVARRMQRYIDVCHATGRVDAVCSADLEEMEATACETLERVGQMRGQKRVMDEAAEHARKRPRKVNAVRDAFGVEGSR